MRIFGEYSAKRAKAQRLNKKTGDIVLISPIYAAAITC
jgi:hypothetical protein